MALTKPLSVPVIPGMREELSPHLSPVGTLVRAQNVRFPVGGEARSRPGTNALSVATTATYTPAALAGKVDYLRECNGGFLFGIKGFGFRYDMARARVDVSGSYGNAIPTGRLVTMAREEVLPTTGTAAPWPLSQAYLNGYVACMYSVGNGQGSQGPATDGFYCQVYTQDGSPVTGVNQYGIGTASAGWVLTDAVTGCFIIIKQDGAGLWIAKLTPTATGFVFTNFTLFAALSTATSYWGACSWTAAGGGIGWALIYQSNGTTVTVAAMLGAAANNTNTFAVASESTVSVFCDATNLYAGWSDFAANTSNARVNVYNSSLGLVGGPTLLSTTAASAIILTPPLMCSAKGGGVFAVVGNSPSPGSFGSKTRAMLLASNGTLTSPGTNGDVLGAFPVSAPFNNGMVWVRNDLLNGIPNVRCELLDYQLARVGSVATTGCANPKVALVTEQFVNLVSSGYYGGFWRHHLCPPVAIGATNEWVCGLPRIVRLETHLSASAGLVLADWVRFSTEAPRPAVPFGSSALVAGDLVLAEHPWGTGMFSGAASLPANQSLGSDVGFYAPPQGGATASTTGPGSLNSSATYQYRIVIERIDSNGKRYRSAPSPVFSMTTAAGNNTGTIAGYFANAIMRSNSRDNVAAFVGPEVSQAVMHVYRTSANQTSAGAQFYRCTPPQGAPVIVAGAATYVDYLSDVNLTTREFIYTDGGVLNNDHPPSAAYIALSEDRVWLGGLFDANQVQSSKILVPGEAPQFSDSPAFRVVLPAPNTGIACQDGAVVAFTKRGIYAIHGFGPTDQGQGDWGTPRVISRSVGSVGGWVLETSMGIFFQSGRGIELLPRGLGEPQFIGAPVFATLGNAMITSAAVISSGGLHTARFCFGSTNVLVFDLDVGAWSVDVYPAPVTAICDTDNGAVVALASVTAGGFGFYMESSAATRDAVGDVPAEIAGELKWSAIHPFTIAGWGRVNCAVGMFDQLPTGYRGSCGLEITVGGNPETIDTGTFDATLMPSPGFRKITPSRMDGSYARLRLTTTAGGWRFLGWTLDLDDHGGSRRVAGTEQA